MAPHSCKVLLASSNLDVLSKVCSITPSGYWLLGGTLCGKDSGFHGHVPSAPLL